MMTYKDNIIAKLREIEIQLNIFLSDNTKITPIQKQNDTIRVMSFEGDHWFLNLDDDGIRNQDKLIKSINKNLSIIEVLLLTCTPSQRKEFEDNKKKLLKLIEQTSAIFKYEIDNADETIGNIIKQLNILYPGTSNEPLLVTDTNALYDNSNFEGWVYPEFKKFKIILTPSVLSDLDEHKVYHRNESIKEIAKSLIKRIKEYRRRGTLSEGVSIVNNRSQIQTIATEPNFNQTLGWLDKSNKDDRLIAEFLEVARGSANSPVYLVTSDINLQNKCEFSWIPYIEPPQSHEV